MADGYVVSGRIGIVLPSRESFALAKSGAVALCARDFARFSRFPVDIFGAGPCEYSDVAYRHLAGWRRWWRRDRDAYTQAVAEAARGYALLEVQNRPHMAQALRRRLPGARLALHLHNDPQGMQGSKSAAERIRLLDICDAVYCVSDFVRARFLADVADPSGKAVTVWNGVAAAAGAEKAPVVAFTGRILPAKGVAELVRAFVAADLGGWRLALAGSDSQGLLAGLAAERAALGDRFEWRGQVSHAQAMALLGEAEIAVVPSVWEEPFGRAAVEAMAQGAALIASRRGALTEVCGDAALYVDPGDVGGFAQALRRLAGDVELRRTLQAAGRARVAQCFEIGAATARLDGVRARVLSGG